MLRLDVTRKLVDLEGKPLEDDGGTLTLRRVCVNALLSTFRGEELAGEKKLEHYRLARRIQDRNPIDLASNEQELLKERIGKAYGPVVSGQAWELLDPPPTLPAEA